MRLTKPSFYAFSPTECESLDFISVAERGQAKIEDSAGSSLALPRFGLSDMFVLPSGVG